MQKTTYICSVKEFIRHIEILLLDNDCVVIPGFGGFVTSHAPSTYIENEHLFLPPIRTVGFNEQLKEDDGLLCKAYCMTYHISDQEAKDLITSHIQAIQNELLENGTCDLGSIGIFTMEEGNIRFSPCEAGTVCPSFYGLDAIIFPKLETNRTEIKNIPQNHEKRISVKSDEIVIRIKKSWLNNIAAVAAVVIMFLIISPKAQNTGIISSEKADFALLMSTQPTVKTSEHQDISAKNKKKDISEQKKADAKNEIKNEKATKPEAELSEHSSTISKKDDKENEFFVVVASAIPEANAKAFVSKLHKEGFTDATLYKNGEMIRVVFPGFSSETEAYQKLKSLRQRSDKFNSAWVLSNK